jgi:uncharacterized protein
MPRASTPIVCRRVNIEFDPAKACGWHGPETEIEDFLNAVSFIFPVGERFFIQSVRNYQDRITDPVLKEQVRQFIFQEAMHSREHTRCNLALIQPFPNGNKIEKYCDTWLSLTSRFIPKASQLACTCAFEHFTAILADGLLKNQEAFLAESEPAFAALWLWHAAEETEHKAVCFDVYQQVVGNGVFSYLHRIIVMFLSSVRFLLTLHFSLTQIRKDKKQDKNIPIINKPKDEASPKFWHLIWAIVSPALYFDYYKPSFHPWKHDNAHLVEEWKQRYRDFGVAPHAVPHETSIQ